jgi:thiamine-phosphate pyrophosphorylase
MTPQNWLITRLRKSRLYLVTDQALSMGRSTIEVVHRALDGGVDIVQLREYSLSDSELLKVAIQVRKLTRQYRALFIVNNRPDIALLSRADGVHIGQEDLPVNQVRRLIGHQKIIGVSTHELAQALHAVKAGADYIGVGPIYPTKTKKHVGPPVTLKYIQTICNAGIPVPFFAIGGIKLHNLESVMMSGARRVAIVSEIVSALKVKNTTQRIKNILKRFSLS